MDLKKFIEKPSVEVIALFITLFLFIISDRLIPADSGLSFIPTAFAGLVVLEMILLVATEVKENTKKHGWKNEIVDTVIALAVALGIWFAAIIILNTSSPISGVVSCSMLPNLYRGDFVIVQGAEPAAHAIEMSEEDFSKFDEEYSRVHGPENSYTVPGSLFSFCFPKRVGEPMCDAFWANPASFIELRGPLEYRFSMCQKNNDDGTVEGIPCVESVSYDGVKYLTDFSNDVVVYQPPRTDLYSRVGDIVHRVFFKIDVDGERYYVTRGDNNPVLDIQVFDYSGMVGNHPVSEENYKGKVIFRVPILGYFKLLISGFWQEDAQCKWQLEYEHLE